MDSPKVERLIEAILGQGPLSTAQQIVLQGFLNGRTYEEMAALSAYEVSYLKVVGAKLCRACSTALGQRVTKSNFPVLVERLQSTDRIARPTEPSPELSSAPTIGLTGPSGRQSEFEQLLNDLQSPGFPCQIWISGQGGIGKTTLALALQETLTPHFGRVLFRSLVDAPPIDQLVDSLLRELDPDHQFQWRLPPRERMERLLQYLGQEPTLLILDNAETLLDTGSNAGDWRPGQELYGELLLALGRFSPSTRVLITSREVPTAVGALTGTGAVKVIALGGLPLNAFRQLGQQLGLENDLALTRLHGHLGGSPLALKLVSATILGRFGGSITDFLEEQRGLTGGIADLLDQHLARLSDLELTVWIWLAIARQPLAVTDLQQLPVPTVSRLRLVRALEALQQRQLIEVQHQTADQQRQDRYQLQPVLAEYVSQLFRQQVLCELEGEPFDYLDRFCLIRTDAPRGVLEAQQRFLVAPLVQALQQQYPENAQLGRWARQLLTRLHSGDLYRNGFASGNVLTLLRPLSLPLQGWNFRGLPIRQADLRHPGLAGADFQGSSLHQCAWLQELSNPIRLVIDSQGQRLYCGDSSGYLRAWSLDLQKLEQTVPAHRGMVSALAVSGDGQRLATAGEDDEIAFWDARHGTCLRRFQGHRHRVWGLAFHPRESLISSIGLDGQLIIWDWNSGARRLAITLPAPGYQLCYSRDGQHLLTATADGLVSCWNSHTGVLEWRREISDKGITALALDAPGQRLACGDDDGGLALFDLQRGEILRQWRGHRSTVSYLAFSPADGSLLSSSLDDCCILWGPDGISPRHTFRETGRIWGCTFAPDGQFLYYGTDSQQILQRQVQTGDLWHEVSGYSDRAWAVGCLQDWVVVGLENGDLQLLDVTTGQERGRWVGHRGNPFCLAIAPDQRHLASGGNDAQIRLWDTESGVCERILNGHQAFVMAIAYSPDGCWLASGDAAGEIRLWDVDRGNCLHQWQAHAPQRVYSLAFSPDGRWLASGGSNFTWRLWCTRTWQLQQSIDVGKWVWALDWHPDSQRLATSGGDDGIWVWDAPSGQLLQKLSCHQRAVKAIRWQRGGEHLVSASFDHSLRHWHPGSGICVQTFQEHQGWIWGMDLVPNQPWVITASHDQSIRCWDLKQGRQRWRFDTPRPYAGLQLAECQGLNPAQQASLAALGASVEPGQNPHSDKIN